MELAVTLPPLHFTPRNGISPFTFLCFVNDIPLNVASKIKLYVDDIYYTVLYTLKQIAPFYKKTLTTLLNGPKTGTSFQL